MPKAAVVWVHVFNSAKGCRTAVTKREGELDRDWHNVTRSSEARLYGMCKRLERDCPRGERAAVYDYADSWIFDTYDWRGMPRYM